MRFLACAAQVEAAEPNAIKLATSPMFLHHALSSVHRLLWGVPGEAVPGDDPSHAVNEREHDEEMDDGRDGMPGAASGRRAERHPAGARGV